MFERREQQRLAFEVADRFFVLRRIEMRLDHLFYGSRRVTEIAIFREINCAHAAAADAANDLVTAIQYRAWFELLYGWLMPAGGAFVSSVHW